MSGDLARNRLLQLVNAVKGGDAGDIETEMAKANNYLRETCRNRSSAQWPPEKGKR